MANKTRAERSADDFLRQLSRPARTTLRRNLARSFDHLDVLRLGEIGRNSVDDVWQRPIDHGLILFGSAPNGDAWAVDLRRGERVVVLAHDLIWGEMVDSPRKGLEPVAKSLQETLAWARDCALPVDYYDALELRAALKRASKKAAPLVRQAVGRCFNIGLEVAVPLKSYVANRTRPTPPEGYSGRAADLFDLLRRVRKRRTVQEVLMRISSLDGAWPTSDAVYLMTSAALDQVVRWFGPCAQVSRGWKRPGSSIKRSPVVEDKPAYGIPKLKKGYKVYTLTWPSKES